MYAPYPPPPGYGPYYPPPPPPGGAPYRAEVAWPAPALGAAKAGMRWAYLALAIVSTLSFLFGIVVVLTAAVDDIKNESYYRSHHIRNPSDLPTVAIVGFAVLGLWCLGYLAKLVIGLVWLHNRWSWLPPDQRYAKTWSSWISPGAAIGFLCIPYFQLYWMFVVTCGLCDGLDRLRMRYPTQTAPPKSMAIASCICHLVPGVNLLVAPFLWFFFMRGVDVTMTEIAGAIARTQPPGQAARAA